MQREGFTIPLLIGGATTSRVHTAVKIAPRYTAGPVVHVTDASRAVGVAGALMNPASRDDYMAGLRAEYADVADKHERSERAKQRLPLTAARANALRLDWAGYVPPAPTFTGTRVVDDWDLGQIVRYIDWTPFFQTWELKGVYPKILDDPTQGEAARALMADARAMLDRIVAERWFTPRAVVGLIDPASTAWTSSSSDLICAPLSARFCTWSTPPGETSPSAAYGVPGPAEPTRSGSSPASGAGRPARSRICSPPIWTPIATSFSAAATSPWTSTGSGRPIRIFG